MIDYKFPAHRIILWAGFYAFSKEDYLLGFIGFCKNTLPFKMFL
jgi:hypothetical protein